MERELIIFMTDELFHRQLDILAPSEIKESIGIIGIGGIGSPTALVLAKMGIPKMMFWDDDKVESHNLPNQLFREKDVGQPKTEALGDILLDYVSKAPHTPQEKKWDGTIKDIMICVVDAMDTRKEIWEQIKGKIACKLYIEARMGGEILKIYMVNPTSPSAQKSYEKTLYSSEEANELPCTARAIFYNCFIIAGLIGLQVKKHLKGEPVSKEIIFNLEKMEFYHSL